MKFARRQGDSTIGDGALGVDEPVAAARVNGSWAADSWEPDATRPVGVFDLVERPEIVVGAVFVAGFVIGRLARRIGR